MVLAASVGPGRNGASSTGGRGKRNGKRRMGGAKTMEGRRGKSGGEVEMETKCFCKYVTLNFHPQGRNVNDVTNEGKS